jgi:hypothetical protein
MDLGRPTRRDQGYAFGEVADLPHRRTAILSPNAVRTARRWIWRGCTPGTIALPSGTTVHVRADRERVEVFGLLDSQVGPLKRGDLR